jgi:hypothetical protein
MGTVVPRLWAGIIMIKCFMLVVGGNAMGTVEMLGYGIGTVVAETPTYTRVLQTSGMAKAMPPNEQLANISSPFTGALSPDTSSVEADGLADKNQLRLCRQIRRAGQAVTLICCGATIKMAGSLVRFCMI